MGKGPERPFSKENILLANKHRTKCMASLAARKKQIKITRYHVTPARVAPSGRTDVNKRG